MSTEPKNLSPGAYWYVASEQQPIICEKREGEDFVRFTNGSRQSRIRTGANFIGPLPAPPDSTAIEATPACARPRQQLSCDSKEILERAAHTELNRLKRLHNDVCWLGADSKVLAQLDAETAKVELAIRQLIYVYIDQFEEGRAENDRYGRHGLGRD